MKTNPHFTAKQIILFITYAILLYLGLTHISTLGNIVSWLVAILQPIIIGCVTAFILNVVMGLFKRKLFGKMERSRHKAVRAMCMPLCVFCTVLCVIAFLLLIIFMIIPQVTAALTTLIDKLPQSAKQFKTVLVTQMTEWSIPQNIIDNVASFSLDWKKVIDLITNFIDGNQIETVVSGAFVATTSVISTATNFFLGVIIAIYILAKKERFMFYVHCILKLIIPKKYHEENFRIFSLAKRSCANFLTGQLLEAIIIGVLCTVLLAVLKFPYPAAIGVLVGITALIPIIGAWIGGGVGLLLVWVDAPEKAIWFLVFIIALQFVEGQFIYPKVVGDSLGLPGLVVLLAVILGTSFGGITGIFIAVPLSAILYTLLKEAIEARNYHYQPKNTCGIPTLSARNNDSPKEESYDTLAEAIDNLQELPDTENIVDTPQCSGNTHDADVSQND